MGRKRSPDRELLLANHDFPGEYVVKAFGPGRDEFLEAVRSSAHEILGERFDASTRHSSKGARSCVTLRLQAETVDEVIGVYERLHDIPDLMLIL